MPRIHHSVPYEIAVGQYALGHDYRCEKLLGRGGMGSVYQMVRGELQFRVAMKVIHRDLAARPESVKMFLEEARILKQVGDHPNLVRILDYEKLSDGIPFITMELLDGNSLGKVMRMEPGKPFDRAVAFGIVDQILNGVFELHSQGIVHRDLKPDNVFLQKRHTAGPGAAVKILDCGLAFKDSTKHDGALQGTPKYMAPEQIRCEQVSPQTDIYAIGLILCEMLLGHLPFEIKREGVKEWMDAHQLLAPAPLAQYLDWISPAASDLVLSALDKDPNKRPRSALEFQKRLFLEARRLRDGLPPEVNDDANITTPTPMVFDDEAAAAGGIDRTEPLPAEAPRAMRKDTLRMDVAPTHPAVANVWQPLSSDDPGLTGAQPLLAMARPAAAAAPVYRTPDPRLGSSPPAPLAPRFPTPRPAAGVRAGPALSVAEQSSVYRTSTAGTARPVHDERANEEPSREVRRDIRRRVLVRSTVLVAGLALSVVAVVAVVRVTSGPAARSVVPTASASIESVVPTPPSIPVIPPPSTTASAATAVPAIPPTAIAVSSSVAPVPPRPQPVVRGMVPAAAPAHPKPASKDGSEELFR